MRPPPSDTDFQSILHAVERFADGASVSDLLSLPRLSFARRTLQRRLESLVNDRRLQAKGEGRGRRYWLPSSSSIVADLPDVVYGAPEWLSTEGKTIRARTRRSLAQRQPVGYRGEFLEAYRPNHTFYLPASLRRELEKTGQVGLVDLPAGTYLRQVLNRLLVDLSWNSSRLEGNTYSLLETERLLELGESAEGHNARETQMILNHKAAIEMLADQAGEIGFNRYTICNLHALLSENLMQDRAASGRVRSRAVGISGTVFHPLAVPQLVEERFNQVLEKAQSIGDPFEQAFFSMVHLPYLQPFEDVNKRVSRLAANIPLIKRNLCPLSFIEVEQNDYVSAIIGVYELNRIEYLRDVFAWAYRRSCARYSAVRQSLGDPDPFRLRHRMEIGRLVRGVVQGLMGAHAASKWIAQEAAKVLKGEERSRLIEVVEEELRGLHPGNIARYRLRPSEFEDWNRVWR